MFTTLKYRRHIAVLAALAMVASVLVAAPAVAADPKADYPATFDACADSPSSGFSDVPMGHANAGDIDCIAYYGITRGTSATTYSPLMSVTREHMALFLTRLAKLVGITLASDPSHTFTDIGELKAESQTAIAQLYDLGVTKGTSMTTYSPADNVKRGHMALFIERLMNKMTPIADGDTKYGYAPKDVKAVAATTDPVAPAKVVASPFTDLGNASRNEADAVDRLWELNVASGVSGTAYAPGSDITRAAMAGFMAGVLDHSNARPAGLSIRATNTEKFGTASGRIMISYRTASFEPMTNVSIKTFNTGDTGVTPFQADNKCATPSACAWSDSDELTNTDGNIFQNGSAANTADDNTKKEVTYYAWMGTDKNKDFVKGSSGEVSVTYTAKPQALGIRVTTDINKNATENKVNLDKDSSVVVTAQLIDTATAGTASKAVPKAGVSVAIGWSQGGTAVFPAPAAMKTDDKGQVTFTITGPKSTGADKDDDDRDDIVTFTADVDGDTTDSANPDNETRNVTVKWTDEAVTATKAMATAPKYAIIDDGEVSIRVTASYYDQYGNADAQNDTVTISIDGVNVGSDENNKSKQVRVGSNGQASYRASVKASASDSIGITVGQLGANNNLDADNPPNVLAARRAHKNDDGISSAVIAHVDDDLFIIDTSDRGIAYSYDSGDTFIVDKATVDMAAFETAIGKTGTTVNVVFYVVDGGSIFQATTSSG